MAAHFYDHRKWMEFWEQNEKPYVYEFLDNPTGKKVLDLGCGTGFYSMDLIQRGNRVYGVDVADRMLAEFRRKLGALAKTERRRAVLICADGDDLPIRDSFFDACLIVRTLSHVGTLDKLCREVYRTLAKGGSAVVADLHCKHLYDFTILSDPASGKEIPVLTYKRCADDYVQSFEDAGFYTEKYIEVSYDKCRWRPDEIFDELKDTPWNPVFFAVKFRKI